MDQNLLKNRRLELDAIFKELCPNVYFEPPSTVRMSYPAIRYRRANVDTLFADNLPYKLTSGFEVTLITRDPDEPLIEKIASLPMCRFNRPYVAENLHHFVYLIYY